MKGFWRFFVVNEDPYHLDIEKLAPRPLDLNLVSSFLPTGSSGVIRADPFEDLDALQAAVDGKVSLFAVGQVTYRDTARVTRRTAFYRHYDPEWHRFVRMEDPDMEYED